MKESYNDKQPEEEYQKPNVKLGTYSNELPTGGFTREEDQGYFDKRLNSDGEYFARHPELLSDEYELIKESLGIKSNTVEAAKLQKIFELYGNSLQRALEYSIYNSGVYWQPKSGKIMRGERLDVESQKLQDRFVNVIWRVLQQYPVDKMLDPEFGRSASGFIELNQLVDAVTHDREAAEHPEYRHNNRLTAAFRKFTRAGLAMLGLGAVVNNNALANPVTTADNEFAQKLSGFPALVVSPPAQAGVYDFDGGEGGGDGPEGGPGEDLVELMAGVREIRAIYTTSIEAQDAVDAINRRLFKIGAFQSNQAKYLKKNPSESNSLNLFVRKLEASKTTAESEVTRLQTAEAAAKLDAAKPAPAPATPSIEDQIVESRVEKVLAEINYFKEKISFLKNELRSSTISAANRTTFNSSLKEAEDYLRQLETTILGDAADKNNIKQSEKILFSAQQKKADKLALEQVKTLDQARAAADSLMIPVVGVQKSYTSHESALEAFNNCTARLDELEAFTEATNGSNTLQDRDPLKWSKLVGYISLVKQQKIDAMSAWQRLQATVNNRDAAAVAETDTVDVVKTRNSRKLAAETNAGRLDDAQGRVAEAQALEGLNSMPKFSEANADDAKRAANAAEDVFDANDAHEDIASTKAEVARANRIAELTLKPNKTKAEEAELRELKREELSPLQKQIIKIRTHKDYEDLSSKQKQKLVDDLIRTDASSGSVLPPGVYPGNSAGYNLITGQPNQMMQTQNTSDTIRTNVEQNLKNTVDIRVTGDQSKESVENRDMSFGQKFSRHHKNSAGKFEYQFGISTHEAALAEARLIMQDNEYAIKATWNAMFKQYDNLPQDIKDKVSRMTYDTDGEQYILDLFNSGDALSRMARHGLRFAGEPMGNLHLTTQIDAAGNITYLVRKPYEKGWGLYLARPDASGAAYYGAITDASAGQGSAWDGSCFGQPGPDGLHSHTSSYSREVITVNNTVFNTISSQYIYTTPPDYVPPGYRLVCDESTGLYGLLAVNINIQKNVQQEVQWLDDGRRSPKQRPVEKKPNLRKTTSEHNAPAPTGPAKDIRKTNSTQPSRNPSGSDPTDQHNSSPGRSAGNSGKNWGGK